MKSIKDYDLFDGEWLQYKSQICSIASSIDFPHNTGLAIYINDLCFSYFNQWQLVIDSYTQLEVLHRKLNSLSDVPLTENLISEYDLYSIEFESSIRDYCYLLIVSIKSLLDLFVCLVDVIVNREIREYHKMPDMRNVRKHLLNIQPISVAIEEFTNPDIGTWVERIKLFRDSLIHRGCRLKPFFKFEKSSELIIKLIRGNAEERGQLNVGDTFDEFIIGLSKFEKYCCKILQDSIPLYSHGPIVEMSYRTSGGVTFYNITQVDAL